MLFSILRVLGTHFDAQSNLLECVGEALDLVPVAAGEVWNFDRHRIVLKGDTAEFLHTAPFRSVIDVFVQRKPLAPAIAEPLVHDVIHAAVPSYFLRLVLDFLNEIRRVGNHEGIELFLRNIGVAVYTFH